MNYVTYDDDGRELLEAAQVGAKQILQIAQRLSFYDPKRSSDHVGIAVCFGEYSRHSNLINHGARKLAEAGMLI